MIYLQTSKCGPRRLGSPLANDSIFKAVWDAFKQAAIRCEERAVSM